MPVSVYYVCALQKRSKNKSAQKIWKNYRNSKRPEDPRSQKERRRRVTRWPHLAQARSRPGRAWGWWAHLGYRLASLLRLFISFEAKTLSLRPRNVPQRRHHRRQDSGDRKSLFWHSIGTGNCPRSHLHRLHCHLPRRCWFPWWGGSSSPPGLRALPVAMWFTSLSHDVIFMWSWALYHVEQVHVIIQIFCVL